MSDQTQHAEQILRDAKTAIRMADQWLTVAQAVHESGLHEDTIRRHIAKGALPVRRIGPTKRLRIMRVDFLAYLNA